MRILAAFLVLSALLHLCAIFLLPAFGLTEKKDDAKTPLFVEIAPIEIPKPAPKSPPSVKPERADKPAPAKSDRNLAERPGSDFKNAGAPEPLLLPDITVPETEIETEATLPLPDIISLPANRNAPFPQGPDIDSEIDSVRASRMPDAKAEAEAVSREKIPSRSDVSGGEIYDFDVPPTNGRKVVYAPEAPDFALENDAKVALKFSIDNSGKTTDIIFVTRNDARVEKLALDYVSAMRFNAVVREGRDTAQITITFKVRK